MSQEANQAGVILTALCDSIRESVHHPKKNGSQQMSPALFQIDGQIDEMCFGRSRGQQILVSGQRRDQCQDTEVWKQRKRVAGDSRESKSYLGLWRTLCTQGSSEKSHDSATRIQARYPLPISDLLFSSYVNPDEWVSVS